MTTTAAKEDSVNKTPGQRAYEAHWSVVGADQSWGTLDELEREHWERVAAAVTSLGDELLESDPEPGPPGLYREALELLIARVPGATMRPHDGMPVAVAGVPCESHDVSLSTVRGSDNVEVTMSVPPALVYPVLRAAGVEVVDEYQCTGVAASWCPACGTCTCPRDDHGQPELRGTDVVYGPACPLHGEDGWHSEAP